jgi:RNA polymerase sigma-70 factor (ECF subfamily)
VSPPPHDDFAELYRANGGRLVVQLYAYTQDLSLAEDLVHEAFCRALDRWSRVSRYEDPVGWVRRVAWNLAVSDWRRVRRERGWSRELAAESVPGPNPDRVVLMRALATLPVPQRRAVIMYYLGDMSVTEIAGVEGATENAIKQRLHRGRGVLAGHLVESRPEVGNG